MATGLPRSDRSFRRQGSSGLIFDDKFIQAALKQASEDNNDDNKEIKPPLKEIKTSQDGVGSTDQTLPRSRSRGGGGSQTPYRTVKGSSPPSVDPPSPKVGTGCGLCGIFGKPASANNVKNSRNNKHDRQRFEAL